MLYKFWEIKRNVAKFVQNFEDITLYYWKLKKEKWLKIYKTWKLSKKIC